MNDGELKEIEPNYISTASAQPWREGITWREMDEPTTSVGRRTFPGRDAAFRGTPHPSESEAKASPPIESPKSSARPTSPTRLLSSGLLQTKVVKRVSEDLYDPADDQQRLPSSPSRYVSTKTREIVWERDDGACVSCGATFDLHFDHIIPLALGGSSGPENIQSLCVRCNCSKGAQIR